MPEINAVLSIYVDAVRRSESFQDLRAACVVFFRDIGAVRVSYHHLPPPGAVDYSPQLTVAAEGFPEDWVDRYVGERLYDIDPIPKRALDGTSPFWWLDVDKFGPLNNDERHYMRLLKASGIGEGLAVPVFGPHGRNGDAGVGLGKTRPAMSSYDVMRLQWGCQIGHLRYCELLLDRLADGAELSRRESEILGWVARGKSNSIIAQLIGISGYTVDTYLRRIYVKLGVSDRVTAALRGMALGLITSAS